ncbi:MAG: hypothetical protein ACJA0P_003046, partial [Planctomycetota bacterium]
MSYLRFWARTALVAAATLVGMSALPDNEYLRFQDLTVGYYAKAQWVYERIVLDKTPIDVAFFGTSHTLNGVDSEVLEKEISDELGRPVHVVNCAIPHTGRDIQFTLMALLLEHRTPELIVLESRYTEGRDTHPATHYLADRSDLLGAPLVVNKNYFSNLARIPYRQLKLFVVGLAPEAFGYTKTLDPAAYDGPHVNFTSTRGPGGVSRDTFITEEELLEARHEYERNSAGLMERSSELKSYLSFNVSYTWVRRMGALAKGAGVPMMILNLPHFGDPLAPQDRKVHDELGPTTFLPAEVLSDVSHWYDGDHFNAKGGAAAQPAIARAGAA